MTDEERQQGEIARDEHWLAGVCESSEAIDTKRIKQRVRIEIGERWLDGRMSDEVPADFTARMRQRVRRAVQAAQAGVGDDPGYSLRRRRRLFISIGGAVGVAAAITIAWIGLGPAELAPTEPETEMELLYADAFEQFEDDEFDVYLSGLRDDLTQLAAGSADGSLDDMLDGLFDNQVGESGDPTQTDDQTDGPVGMSHWPAGSGA